MSAGEPFYLDPTFWVAGSFIVFVGGVVYLKAHKAVGSALDARTNAIRAQINEAKSLRDEAEKLLADYQRKQRDAEKEAAEIVAQAQEDARIMVDDARKDIAVMVERRTRAAEDKIRQAEAAAVKEVKAVAVNVAVEAATRVLDENLKGKSGGALVDAAIADMEGKLH